MRCRPDKITLVPQPENRTLVLSAPNALPMLQIVVEVADVPRAVFVDKTALALPSVVLKRSHILFMTATANVNHATEPLKIRLVEVTLIDKLAQAPHRPISLHVEVNQTAVEHVPALQ